MTSSRIQFRISRLSGVVVTATIGVSLLTMLAIWVCTPRQDSKALFYYQQAFSQSRRIEQDPAKEVRYLRGAAGLFDNPEHIATARRGLGVSPAEDGFDSAWAAELRARADAIEAAPGLYAQTQRCAADIVAERFRIEELGRRGPQRECGHCVRSPSCKTWRPGAAIART
ncbi:MAG: hypothetical protein OXP73_05600 [Chloroflexota bacterium]|nr:hypothetical protein [Chloroflexota bacterium]